MTEPGLEQRSKEDLKYWDIWVQSQDLSTDGKGVGQGQEEGVCVCMCVLGKRLVPLRSPSPLFVPAQDVLGSFLARACCGHGAGAGWGQREASAPMGRGARSLTRYSCYCMMQS